MNRRLCSTLFAVASAAAIPVSAAHAEPPKSPAVEFYGFLKAGPIVGQDVETFGQPNSVAVTAAAHPLFTAPASDSGNRYLSFQAAQTRFGLRTTRDAAVTGQIELDFIDFAKASPTVASMPRLRIAKVDWRINDSHTITAGQDWDLFNGGAMVPHTYNWVGALFQAGNTGFMRQQVQYKAKVHKGDGGTLELGLAVGAQGNSNGPSLSDIEHSSMPMFAARLEWTGKNGSRIGISGAATQLHISPRDATMFAVGLHGDLFFGATKSTNLRFEGTFGQNMNNTGLLTLGQGTKGEGMDVREAGGYISLKQTFLDGAHGVWLAAGMSHVLTPDKLLLGYTPAVAPTGSAAAVAAARVSTNGPGILRNFGTRIGYEFKPLAGLSLFAEGFFYNTWHKLADADAAKYDPTNLGYGGEAGLLYFF